jgi:phage-related protein
MTAFLTWLKIIPTVLSTVMSIIAALEQGFAEVAGATGNSAAQTGTTKLDVVRAALQSLYATEQSVASVIPFEKLTTYVTSITSTLVDAFNKLGWFKKSTPATA